MTNNYFGVNNKHLFLDKYQFGAMYDLVYNFIA